MKAREQNNFIENNETRYSLGFEKKEKENQLSSIINKESRARSAKPLLLKKYIPKLEPINSNLNPSIITWIGKYNSNSNKKYNINLNFNSNINIVDEEDYEISVNSGDERYAYNKLYYKNEGSVSSFNDSDSFLNKDTKEATNEDTTKSINNNINLNMNKNKKYIKDNIENLRKNIINTKSKMKQKKEIDDFNIITKASYPDYIRKNYFINQFKENNNINENSFEYEFDFKNKSKSIYFKGDSGNKGPILSFLQTKDKNNNMKLSQSNFSDI